MIRFIPLSGAAAIWLGLSLATATEPPAPAGVNSTFPQLTAGDKTFHDVVVTAVHPDRISFTHSTGLTTLSFEQLPPDLQKRFGLDAQSAGTHREIETQKAAQAELRTEREREAAQARAEKLKAERAAMEAAATPAPTPPHVSQYEGEKPVFHGVPLAEILNKGVIVSARTPLYEISGGDGGLRETAEQHQEMSSERFKALQDTARNAHPGRLIGHVRKGFLLQHLGWKFSVAAPVFLPAVLGGAQYACLPCPNGAAIGHDSWRSWWNDSPEDPFSRLPELRHPRFRSYPLSTKTTLMDPFSAEEVVLANSEGEMKNAWLIDLPTEPEAGPLQINHLPLAVVETKDGLFLGALTERDQDGSQQITWEQAAAEKSKPYFLTVKQTKPVKSGTPLFALFESNSRLVQRAPSSNPLDFLIEPHLFAEILEKGVWSLKTNFLVPQDAGFEPVTELETQTSYSFELEKKLERVQLVLDSLNESRASFLVVSQFERREVERSVAKNGYENIRATPWKRQKEQLTVELGLPVGGALHFTDGELIYRLSPGRFQPELTIYTVEASRITR